jgi:hypothetical protein
MNLLTLIQEVIDTLSAQGTPVTHLTINFPIYEALTREIRSTYYGTVDTPVIFLCKLFGLTVTVDVESDSCIRFSI